MTGKATRIKVLALLLLVLNVAVAGQVVVNRVSIEELSARAPVIVLARRTSDEPLILEKSEPVKLQDGSTKTVTTQFSFWHFTVVDGIRNRYRGELPRELFVIAAYAELEDDIYRESLAGPSISYGQEWYEDGDRRLHELGSEPVILFLYAMQGPGMGFDLPPDAHSLFIGHSIAAAARFDDVREFSLRPYEDPTRLGYSPDGSF